MLSERHRRARGPASQANYGSRMTRIRSDRQSLCRHSKLLDRNNTLPTEKNSSHAIVFYKAQRHCYASSGIRLHHDIIAFLIESLPLRRVILLHVSDEVTLLRHPAFDSFDQHQALHAAIVLLVYVVREPGGGPVATAAGRPWEKIRMVLMGKRDHCAGCNRAIVQGQVGSRQMRHAHRSTRSLGIRRRR